MSKLDTSVYMGENLKQILMNTKFLIKLFLCLSLTIFDIIIAKHVFAFDVVFQVENVMSSFFK